MAERITKIYDLQILGSKTVLADLDKVNKSFADIKKLKADLNKQKTTIEDPEELKVVTDRLKELKVVEQETTVELKKKKVAVQELNIVRKQQIIDSAKAREEAKKEKQSNDILAGSYKDIQNRYNELRRIATSAIPLTDPKQVAEAAAELKRYKVLLDDFNRSLSPDGTLVGEYTTGIINAFKRLGLDDIIKKQVNNAKSQLDRLDQEFSQIRQELSDIKVTGDGSFESLERKMIENRREAAALEKQISEVQTTLNGVGGVGKQVTDALSSNFKNLKKDFAGFVVGYLGVQEAIGVLRRGVDLAGELADKTTDIEIELGGAVGSADDLISRLSAFDTRDKLIVLEEIANVAQRAGTSADNLEDVTIAIDKTKIAFGRDFGDVETGTETFAQLINIFYDDGEITGDRILKIGNAIRTLANETVASVPFINDFSGRMAGLRQIANITLPEVIGLGAGFQEFKQTSEVASTALVKIIPQLAKDTEKFAAVIGVTNEEFKKLVDNDPVEALLRVSEALVKNEAGLTGVAEALADADLSAGRVTTILGTLGGKADVFRERILRAKSAIQETTAVEDAFERKNNNLAATLDKIGKKFADTANSKAFTVTLSAIATLITFLLGNLPLIITLLGLWAAGWALANKELLIQRGLILLFNTQIAISKILLGALNILQAAYAAGLNLITGAYSRATSAAVLFSSVLRITPLGALFTILGLVAAGFVAFGAAVTGSTEGLRAHTIAMRVNQEVQERALKSTASTIANMQTLLKVVNDNTASLETRKRALQDLININPEYLNGLTLENAKTKEGTELIQGYIKLLKEKAAFEAAQAVRSEKLQRDIELAQIEFNLQKRVSSGTGTDIEDLTDKEKAFVGGGRKAAPFTASVTDLFTGGSAADEALAGVQAERARLSQELDATDKLIEEKYLKMGETIEKGPSGAGGGEPELRTPAIIRKEIKEVTAELNKYDKASKEAEALRAKLAGLRKELKEALGTGGSAGDRLDQELQNKLRDIDAVRDTNIANEQLRFSELKKQRQADVLDQITHLNNTLDINRKATNDKLQLLKGTNSQERKEVAELKLQLVREEEKTNLEIFKLRIDDLTNQKDYLSQKAKNQLEDVEANPAASDSEKAAAKVNYYDTLLALQRAFMEQADQLEQQYGQQSEKSANERYNTLLDLRRSFNKALAQSAKDAAQNEFNEIEGQFSQSVNNIRAKVVAEAYKIFSDQSLTASARDKKLKDLEQASQKEILSEQREYIERQIELNEYLHDNRLISDQEYYKQKLSLAEQWVENQKDLNDVELKNEREKEASRNRILAQAQQTINAFRDLYVASQNAKIDATYEEKTSVLDAEKEKRLAQAGSREEELAIEQEFAQRQKQAEVERSNARKQVARSQLAIEFALASMKALSTSTTIAEGIVKEAFVFAEYLAKLAIIDSQKFARGGDVPTDGGAFGGRSHAQGGTPFMFQGRSFEAEAGELAIINKRSSSSNRRLTVSGTPKQIASAINTVGGGVNFAPGASMASFAYGGSLGRGLGVPSFISSYYISKSEGDTGNAQMFEMMMRSYDAIVSTNSRIDRLQVIMDPNAAARESNKYNKSVSVGLLQ